MHALKPSRRRWDWTMRHSAKFLPLLLSFKHLPFNQKTFIHYHQESCWIWTYPNSLCSNTRDHWNYHQLFVWGLIVTMDSLKMILRLWLCGANQYLCQVENKRGSGMQSDLDLTFLFWPNENPLLFPLCPH